MKVKILATSIEPPEFLPRGFVVVSYGHLVRVVIVIRDRQRSGSVGRSALFGPIVVDARLTAVTRSPTLQFIAPYRQALVVYVYEIVKVHQGINPGPRILVHHWALRDDRTVAPSTRIGETVRLAVEPFDTHSELQGERVIADMETLGLPMFYEPPR
jgi:hypothetical protein